jgi:hypothetical protein
MRKMKKGIFIFIVIGGIIFILSGFKINILAGVVLYGVFWLILNLLIERKDRRNLKQLEEEMASGQLPLQHPLDPLGDDIRYCEEASKHRELRAIEREKAQLKKLLERWALYPEEMHLSDSELSEIIARLETLKSRVVKKAQGEQ